jgi:hypothetical protein
MGENLSNNGETEPRTPSQEIAGMLSELGEAHGFDAETCDDIGNQPFEEALETAYSYLASAGLDPDEFLAGFFEPPDQD